MVDYSSANLRVAEKTSSGSFVDTAFHKLLRVFLDEIHIQWFVGLGGALEHVVQ